ncbi:MAG TPA: ArsA-related P-loop ATPase [Candidatus Binatia bacterium]|nr:ArsA-related P-loop ATPase [Candidatus Binatia bacterium]
MTALFDRRLLFIVGKGGVGKSTVATALALAAVRRKKRVLLVGLDFDDRSRAIAGLRQAEGPDPVEALPGFFRLNVEGKAALEEYLRLVIPVRRVLNAVFDSKVYQYFVAAAPGLKELMAIGKIWYEVDRGRWDLVIVDSPATGHALQYLRMPKTAYEAFTTGLVHREARRVWGLLTDPRSTAVSVVAVAEELPVNETVTICNSVRGELGLPQGILFVNRFHAPDFSKAELEQASASWRRGVSEPCDALVKAVLTAAEEEVSWGTLNEHHRRKLVAETGWPLVVLPFLFREEFGFADVEALSNRLEEALSPRGMERRAEGHP